MTDIATFRQWVVRRGHQTLVELLLTGYGDNSHIPDDIANAVSVYGGTISYRDRHPDGNAGPWIDVAECREPVGRMGDLELFCHRLAGHDGGHVGAASWLEKEDGIVEEDRNFLDLPEVGEFRYCPACGRHATEPDTGDHDDLEAWRCSCCKRPWPACPCTPAAEGDCRAEVSAPKVIDSTTTILDLGLSTRVSNGLFRQQVRTVGDLTALDEMGVLDIPNFGHVALREIEEILAKHGLALNPCTAQEHVQPATRWFG